MEAIKIAINFFSVTGLSFIDIVIEGTVNSHYNVHRLEWNRSIVMATTLDAILDEIANLSIEDQEMVDEIIHKRVIDGKREEISAAYQAALLERQQGQIKSGTVSDLFGSL